MFEGYGMLQNITAIAYYLFFVLSGVFVLHRLLWKEKYSIVAQCLFGSVAGVLALQWFPLLFAFAFDFTMTAHMLALGLQVVVCIVVAWKTTVSQSYIQHFPYKKATNWKRFFKENPVWIVMLLTFVYFAYCLSTHTISTHSDGSMHAGQCTYGDMNMHLSFITSIANQETFPPEYSLLPGHKLSYPFLCDSISSSLYQFGCSLRLAYILPMIGAILQVFGGLYCFIKYWFRRSGTAFIAWVLFFLNGGLGFLYYRTPQSIRHNFTEFYMTPTNQPDKNLRWVQVIVDMLLPQRATLFGWAVLFPLLAFLLVAVRERKTKLFVMAAVAAGALPMIHTHSFLALGMICSVWLVVDCFNRNREKDKEEAMSRSRQKKNRISVAERKRREERTFLRYGLFLGLLGFSILQAVNKQNAVAENHGLFLMLAGVFCFVLYIAYELIVMIQKNGWKGLLSTWGLFLVIVLALALPQLFTWTFSQATGDQFVRNHFNWSNDGEQYVYFYLKNLGVTFVLLFIASFVCKKKDLQIAAPYFLIFFVAELVAFQPNDYDNNKLLFVGAVFICGLAADVLMQLFTTKWKSVANQVVQRTIKGVVAVCVLFVGLVSAFMTMGREWVSDYELYSASGVEACKYIEQQTGEWDVILTSTQHNSPVPALTGRNIVCGSGSFLYYHGLDYGQQEADVAAMYTDPVGSKDLFEKYGVSYVYVSGQEYGSYQVNEESLQQIADVVWEKDDVRIWELKAEEK